MQQVAAVAVLLEVVVCVDDRQIGIER